MGMKKLLVGSVFADDTPMQQKWLDLQLLFLAHTTHDFDHVVVLSDGKTNDYFEQKTKVIIPGDTSPKGSDAHCNGLNLLLEYFRNKSDDYENFLFLDADAFPIKQNWLPVLLKKMEPMERDDPITGAFLPIKSKWRDYDVASVVRSENLEIRLHASVLFAKKKALSNMTFNFGHVGNDLLGNIENDVHIPFYQNEFRNLALPLIRTNKNNIHPLACGIYYDMFYHHACGSGRDFHMRASGHYLTNIIPAILNTSGFTDQLMKSPCDFIKNLAGWNPSRYANF
jgi:hypothetical protein